jgi:hypothetical protein
VRLAVASVADEFEIGQLVGAAAGERDAVVDFQPVR